MPGAGGEAAGRPGAVLVMGPEVVLRGRAPAQHTRWLSSRSLAAGAETLKSCRWPCLSSPGVVFAGRQFYKPRGPGWEPQAPGGCGPASSVLSLFLGLRAGGRAQAGSGLRLWGESCLAALSPAQDCPQLPVQAQPGLTQCPHGLEPRSSTQIEGRELRAVAAEFLE